MFVIKIVYLLLNAALVLLSTFALLKVAFAGVGPHLAVFYLFGFAIFLTAFLLMPLKQASTPGVSILRRVRISASLLAFFTGIGFFILLSISF